MSKQVTIQVLNKKHHCTRDCTVGKTYPATFYEEGEIKDIDSCKAGEDGYQFVDDVGDKVFIWKSLGKVAEVTLQ